MQKQKDSALQIIEKSIKNIVSGSEHEAKSRMFHELNSFRKDPTILIPYLSKRKQNFSTKPPRLILFSQYHPHKGLATIEGQAPINYLIGTLYSRDKMSALIENELLTLIAEQILLSFNSAKSWSEIKLTESMAKHLRSELNNSEEYNFVDKISCLIGMGFDREHFEPLMSLLIDDGDQTRKNRQLMFNRNLKFVGLATGSLSFKPQLRICVYLFTGNITKK